MRARPDQPGSHFFLTEVLRGSALGHSPLGRIRVDGGEVAALHHIIGVRFLVNVVQDAMGFGVLERRICLIAAEPKRLAHREVAFGRGSLQAQFLAGAQAAVELAFCGSIIFSIDQRLRQIQRNLDGKCTSSLAGWAGSEPNSPAPGLG